MMAQYGLSRPTAMVLVNRGISLEEVPDFINPRLSKLSDPFKLRDCLKAVERIWRAIHNGEKILIFGDFDTDGITATVLLNWVLRENGAKVKVFLPLRMEDGYGLSVSALQKFEGDVDVVITVDCGITSIEGAAWLREKGIDLIITDHHEPGEVLPDAYAIINPKLEEYNDSYWYLSGVGVCFKLCHGFLKYGREKGLGGWRPELREGMDLVTLGTVADIVPLLGENRSLVRYGMKVLQTRHRPGIHALCEICGLSEQLSTEDIAFRLAPRINAAGRMGDAVEALELLQARSVIEAHELAAKLEQLNQKRQAQEELVYQAVKAYIEERELWRRNLIVAWDRDWHPGVLGIVAARIAQEYNRPTIVLTGISGEELSGSGRGVFNCNMIELLEPCRHLLLRYGGHPMAVGLALREENIEQFIETVEAAIVDSGQNLTHSIAVLEIEGVLSLAELTEKWFRERELLQPFGHKNPMPCFMFRNVSAGKIAQAGTSSTRGVLFDEENRRIEFIFFGTKPHEMPPQPWDISAIPDINSYGGVERPQLRILDVRTSLG